MPERNGSDVGRITQIITMPDRSEVMQVRQAHLVVTKGPDKGKKRDIGQPGLVVGSAPDCSFVLTDSGVSRNHLEIVPGFEGFDLRDLDSKNGTMVNSVRVTNALLTGGEEIRLGKSRMQVVVLDKHDQFPLSDKTSFGSLRGRSHAMRRVFAQLERAVATDSTLLLEGESGTGKDLAAESVHLLSERRQGPFVVMDCGAMGPSLVESELFGHRKGAFTGADQDRAGVFESADLGTVFLDEIGELEPGIQVKLLRLLEKKEFRRLGENRYRSVDVRLIAATNRDLAADVETGKFRQDLYFRLSVIRVRLPPLRERREDIGLLAKIFLPMLRPDLDPVEVISDRVLAMFVNHDWPGNVRELRNVLERLILFPENPEAAIRTVAKADSQDSTLLTHDLLGMDFHQAREKLNERFEKIYLSAMLDACDHVVAKAAERSGMARQSFYRLMARHKLAK
jgi:transcriptional regulator with PAS, ATPase and Fis domain